MLNYILDYDYTFYNIHELKSGLQPLGEKHWLEEMPLKYVILRSGGRGLCKPTLLEKVIASKPCFHGDTGRRKSQQNKIQRSTMGQENKILVSR